MIEQGLLEEPDDRTVSPFAAVIEAYRAQASKVATRPPKPDVTTGRYRGKDVIKQTSTLNRVSAAFWYQQQANDLETR